MSLLSTRLLLIVSLLSTTFAAHAYVSSLEFKDAQQIYEQALTLEGDAATAEFNKAKSIYLKALQGSPDNAYLHYNLGTILLQLKDYGPSIFHLQQAYALHNDDQRIAGNLQRARLLAGLQGKQVEDQQLSQIFSTTWSELNPKALQSMAIVLSLLLTIWIGFKGIGKAGIKLRLSLSLVSLLIYLANAQTQGLWMPKTAILLSAENPRSGLGTNYPGLLKEGTLKAGSYGLFIREVQGWAEVEWEQGPRGWVKADKIGVVR